MNTGAKKAIAWIFAILMLASAILHVYWVFGGSWFVATALNADVTELPDDLVWITWVLVVGMLVGAWLALARARVLPSIFNQWVHSAALWFFVGCALLGAGLNALSPRFWDRWIFAPTFLILAALATLLALPEPEIDGRRLQ
jgi:hypothetical protein